MTKLIGILMMVGLWSGCGEEVGEKEVKQVLYYDNGQVKSERNYVDGEKEGKWVEYYENGKVKSERNYVDGKRESK
jgi:antitoxin component YwqK of YwqJK toxin-antitoxin module